MFFRSGTGQISMARLTGTVFLSVAELRKFLGELEENIVVVENGRIAAVDDLGRHGHAAVSQQQTRSKTLVLARFYLQIKSIKIWTKIIF